MRSLAAAVAAVALVAGCTSVPINNPRIERLPPGELAQIPPSRAPQLSLDEIVAMSRDGMPPQAINDRIYASATRLKLTDADRQRLLAAGVSEQVITYIDSYYLEAQRTDALTREAEAQQQARAARKAFEQTYGAYPYPYYGPRIYPYGGYGWSNWGSGWYGGVGIGF